MSAIEIASELNPDDCAARLQEATDHWFFSRFGSRPVLGGVYGRLVSLRRRIGYHNFFQTYLIGTLEENGQATIFRGMAGMHPFAIVFLATLTVVFLLGCLAFAVQNLLAGRGFPIDLIGVPFVAALILSVVQFGRWLARDEERFLVAFMASVICASEEAHQSPAQESGAEGRHEGTKTAEGKILPGLRDNDARTRL
jgi:hypothetical protein